MPVRPLPKSAVERRLYSVPETEIILDRSQSSIWRDIKAGRLVAVHIGGSTKITRESIELVVSGDLPRREPLPKVQAMTERRAAKLAERKAAEKTKTARAG